MLLSDPLPDPLPQAPMSLVESWLADALQRRDQPNPDAMVLATAAPDGAPSARVVLCKGVDAGKGRVRFVSNYHSRKGRELEANPRAALVMHWDHLHRQVRMEGVVVKAPAAESDAYFASRAWLSQIGAHASQQSAAIGSREALERKLDALIAQYGDAPAPGRSIPRPPHWGAYHFWVSAVELWVEGPGRLHDRARWQRELRAAGEGFDAGPWTATRLQP